MPGLAVHALSSSDWLPLAALPFFGYGFHWHWRGRGRFRFNRQSVQANKVLARRGQRGLVYFGGLLGVGLLTEMSSPLVWAGFVYAATSGIRAAAAYAVGFAFGRATPTLAAAANVGADLPPGVIAPFIVVDLRRYTRWLGVATAALGGSAAVASSLGLSPSDPVSSPVSTFRPSGGLSGCRHGGEAT